LEAMLQRIFAFVNEFLKMNP